MIDLGATDADYRVVDLAEPSQMEDLANELSEIGVDVLINNAALGHWDSMWNMPVEKLQSMISLNVNAVAVLSTVFANLNHDRDARLVNVASGAGYALFEGTIPYSASKFFVTALTEGLAAELVAQHRPMRAQLFAPGPTGTDFGTNSLDGSTLKAPPRTDRSPIKVHTPTHAAELAMELFDSDAVVGAVQPDMSFALRGGRHPIGNLIDPDW